MSFEIVPNDTPRKKSRKPSERGTHIVNSSDTPKKNRWKGRYDRRSVPREAEIPYSDTVAANDPGPEKPNSK